MSNRYFIVFVFPVKKSNRIGRDGKGLRRVKSASRIKLHGYKESEEEEEKGGGEEW